MFFRGLNMLILVLHKNIQKQTNMICLQIYFCFGGQNSYLLSYYLIQCAITLHGYINSGHKQFGLKMFWILEFNFKSKN